MRHIVERFAMGRQLRSHHALAAAPAVELGR
jgi:hypothetical protein